MILIKHYKDYHQQVPDNVLIARNEDAEYLELKLIRDEWEKRHTSIDNCILFFEKDNEKIVIDFDEYTKADIICLIIKQQSRENKKAGAK